MSKYYPPQYESENFNCIYCNVYSNQQWKTTLYDNGGRYYQNTIIIRCECLHCEKISYWNIETKKMIIPSESPIQPHHPDMPKEITIEYNEARDIFAKSPRASAALLRLGIQKLMPILGATKGKLDKDISYLVSEGLSPIVQQAFDICRVVGNNAVHPGEIDLTDTPDMAQTLFEMLNYIIEERITKPKAIEEMYGRLPIGALEAIEKRDTKK